MALNETLGIKVVFGGAIGSSFGSAFSKAINDVGSLQKEIDKLNGARDGRTDSAAKIEAAAKEKKVADDARKAAKDALSIAQAQEKAAERAALAAARIAARKKSTKAEKDDAIRLAEAAKEAAAATERAAVAEARAKDDAVSRAKAYEKIARKNDAQNKILGGLDDAALTKKIGLLTAQRNYAEARQNLTKAKDEFISLWKSVAVWTSAITGAVSFATFRLAKSVSETADNAGGLADRLGMTTRALQEMQYAGLLNNLTVEDTNDLLGKMQIRLHDAYQKGGDAADALRLLRLDAASLAYMSPDEAVMEISRALQSVPNASDRAALAVKILGKEGAKMANMLAAGPEELEKLRAEARETGFVLGDDVVKNGRAFDAALKRLGATITGVKNILGGEMLPAFTDLAGQLSGVLLNNMDAFKGVASLLGDVVRACAPALVAFAKGLALISKVLTPLLKLAFDLVDSVGGWPVVFGFLVGFGGYMVVKRLFDIARAVGAVVTANRALAAAQGAGGLTSLLGIGGNAAGAAAGTAVVVRNLSLGTRLWVGLLGGVGALLRWGGAFLGFLQGIVTVLGTIRFFLIGLGSSVWVNILRGVVMFKGFLIGTLAAAGKAVVGFFGTLAGTIVAAIGTAVASFFAGRWLTQWLAGFKWFRSIIDGIGAAVWWVGNQFDKLTASVGAFWQKIKGAPAGIWNRIKGMFGGSDGAPAEGDRADKSASIFGTPNIAAPASASQVSARSTSQGGDSSVSITVNAAPGQSEDAIARKAAALIEQRNRRTNSGSFATA